MARHYDEPGREIHQGGYLIGGPMDGKYYGYTRSRDIVVCGYSLPPWAPGPVQMTTQHHHYRWCQFAGAFLFDRSN